MGRGIHPAVRKVLIKIRKRGGLTLLATLLLAIGGGFYWAILPGLSVADREPSVMEEQIATWLLHQSVPDVLKARGNPLGIHPAAAQITAGRDLFRKDCEICHGYAGDGKTEIASGMYPRPPRLRDVVSTMPDGEIFYHIRNGIRNTAMPAWHLPDAQIWQMVAYIRNLPGVAPISPALASAQNQRVPNAHYVGSAECKSCHEEVYARWSKTRMANVVRDPKTHPDAIIPDLTQTNPLVTFTKADIALVYGSEWKQRYFTKIGDDYFPFPAQWDITHKIWRPYVVPANGGDWWAPMYPGDNMTRPTGPLCDGCHSVNYDIATKTVTEWNVGCERCHGAGSEHVRQPTRDNILNPARMNFVAANDTCIQCHSQGRPVKNPIGGKYYDWPVGFHMGLKLSDYWKLEEHKLGELSFTHFPDGTAHKNRMQGNDFVQSLMYARGVTCFSCHDPHGSENDAMLRRPVNQICVTCHGPNTQNGPHAVSIEEHTHHKPGSTGSECVACHMPKIEQTIADVNVSSHTFHFITPAETDRLKIPNACTNCHTDKTTGWAETALSSWDDRSPWRMNP